MEPVAAPMVGVVAVIALMSPKLWIALALAIALGFSHFFVYRSGKAIVRGEWDAQRLVDAEAARKAIEANREIEAKRQKQAQEAIDESKKREATLRSDAAAARGALDRLRNAVRSASGVLPSGPGDAQREPSSEGRLLAQCAAEYQSLGERADQHASDVQTLTEAWPR